MKPAKQSANGTRVRSQVWKAKPHEGAEGATTVDRGTSGERYPVQTRLAKPLDGGKAREQRETPRRVSKPKPKANPHAKRAGNYCARMCEDAYALAKLPEATDPAAAKAEMHFEGLPEGLGPNDILPPPQANAGLQANIAVRRAYAQDVAHFQVAPVAHVPVPVGAVAAAAAPPVVVRAVAVAIGQQQVRLAPVPPMPEWQVVEIHNLRSIGIQTAVRGARGRPIPFAQRVDNPPLFEVMTSHDCRLCFAVVAAYWNLPVYTELYRLFQSHGASALGCIQTISTVESCHSAVWSDFVTMANHEGTWIKSNRPVQVLVDLGDLSHARLLIHRSVFNDFVFRRRGALAFAEAYNFAPKAEEKHWDTCPVARAFQGVGFNLWNKLNGNCGRLVPRPSLLVRLKSFLWVSQHPVCNCKIAPTQPNVVPVYIPSANANLDYIAMQPSPFIGEVDAHMREGAQHVTQNFHGKEREDILAAHVTMYMNRRAKDNEDRNGRWFQLAPSTETTKFIYMRYVHDLQRTFQQNLAIVHSVPDGMYDVNRTGRDLKLVSVVPFWGAPVRGRCNECAQTFKGQRCACGRVSDKTCARGHFLVHVSGHHVCGICDHRLPKAACKEGVTTHGSEQSRIFAEFLEHDTSFPTIGTRRLVYPIYFSTTACDFVKGAEIDPRPGTSLSVRADVPYRPRRGVTAYGIVFPAHVPVVVANTTRSMIAAVAGRQLLQRPNALADRFECFMTWAKRNYDEVIGLRNLGIREDKASFYAWLNEGKFNYARRQQLTRAAKRCWHQGMSYTDLQRSSFLKHELTTKNTLSDNMDNWKIPDLLRKIDAKYGLSPHPRPDLCRLIGPRNITCCSDYGASALTGPTFRWWSHELAHIHCYSEPIFYACGANSLEYGRWMAECKRLGFVFFVSGDANRYDGHMHNLTNDLLSMVYRRLGATRKTNFWKVHRSHRDHKAVVRMRSIDGFQKVMTWRDPTGSRASGDNDTTFGNSVVAHFLHAYVAASLWCHGNGLRADWSCLRDQVRIALIGDDVVFAFKRQITESDINRMIASYRELGFSYELSVTTDYAQVDFAGGRFMRATHQGKELYFLAPDLRRWLPKIGVARVPMDNPMDWIRSVALGWDLMADAVPIMSAVISVYKRCSRTGRPRRLPDEGGKQNFMKGMLKLEPVHGNDSSWHQVARAYNLQPHQVHEIEAHLLSVRSLPCMVQDPAMELAFF